MSNQAPPQGGDRQSRMQKIFGKKRKDAIKEDVPKINVKGHKAYG